MAVDGAGTPNREAPSSLRTSLMSHTASSQSETRGPISLLGPATSTLPHPQCPLRPSLPPNPSPGLQTAATWAPAEPKAGTPAHPRAHTGLPSAGDRPGFPSPPPLPETLTLRWRGAQRKPGGNIYSQIRKKKFDAIAELIRPPKNSRANAAFCVCNLISLDTQKKSYKYLGRGEVPCKAGVDPSEWPGAARLDHTDPPSGEQTTDPRPTALPTTLCLAEERTEENVHVQNKPQASGSPDTQSLRRPLTSPRARCQAALAPTQGTLRLTLWQARHTHKAGVAESRPPATTAQTPGFALESVSQDFKAQTGPAQPSSACWGHGQAPLCVPAWEWEGQGGSLTPTQPGHPPGPQEGLGWRLQTGSDQVQTSWD